MRLIPLSLRNALLFEPDVHADERGFFVETLRADTFEAAGITREWVQENHSRSRCGVIRGIHFQLGKGQAKLVRCARGEIFDVVVDIRRGSPTFGQWEAHRLNDQQHRQLYIPIGFGHGFCVVSEVADVVYKCSSYYDPELESGFAYDDPDVGIEWPRDQHIVSDRDRNAPRLADIADALPFGYSR